MTWRYADGKPYVPELTGMVRQLKRPIEQTTFNEYRQVGRTPMMTVEEIIARIEEKTSAMQILITKAMTEKRPPAELDILFAEKAQLTILLNEIVGGREYWEGKEPETPTGGDMHWDGTVPLYTSDHKGKP